MGELANEEAIAALLTSVPLCAQIAKFLLEHDGAMDTARGIANCWVNQDEVAVQAALEQLVSVGVISSHALRSGVYYRLAASPDIHSTLQGYCFCPTQPQRALTVPSNRNTNKGGVNT